MLRLLLNLLQLGYLFRLLANISWHLLETVLCQFYVEMVLLFDIFGQVLSFQRTRPYSLLHHLIIFNAFARPRLTTLANRRFTVGTPSY